MRSGVKIKDIATGAGDEAVHGKTVAANMRLFLNHGAELPLMKLINDLIDSRDREAPNKLA
jgi:hypothetical protein